MSNSSLLYMPVILCLKLSLSAFNFGPFSSSLSYFISFTMIASNKHNQRPKIKQRKQEKKMRTHNYVHL